MTGWRMEVTVLTDLSASIFAACFMILLIFLALAQTEQVELPSGPPRVVDASRDLAVTRRQPATPAELVERLFRHGAAGGPTTRIDLFADRIEINAPGRNAPTSLVPAQIGTLAARLGDGSEAPILYVFSNAHYGSTLAALGGRPHLELSVPRGLRDPARPDRSWSQAFTRLGSEGADLATFRTGLAKLLAGSAEPTTPAVRQDGTPPASPAATALDPLVQMGREFARRVAILLTVAGFAAAIAIRFRGRAVIFDTSEESAVRLD